MIRKIKVCMNMVPVKRASSENPDGLTMELPLTGITGFAGPCGCGKTRLLTTISTSVFSGPRWVADNGGFETKNIRVQYMSEFDDIQIFADTKIPEDNELYFIRNPEQFVRHGTTPENLAIFSALFEKTKWDPATRPVFGPVGDLLADVLFKGVGRDYVYMPHRLDPGETFRLPSGLMPFWLVWHMLGRDLLRNNDVLVLDDAAAGMYPTIAVLYAKLLVLLYKQRGVQIIYSSSCPDFVGAIKSYVVHYGAMYDHCTHYVLMRDKFGTRVKEMLRHAEIGKMFDGFNENYDVLDKDTEEPNKLAWGWAVQTKEDP